MAESHRSPIGREGYKSYTAASSDPTITYGSYYASYGGEGARRYYKSPMGYCAINT